jgi:DNA polymerase IV
VPWRARSQGREITFQRNIHDWEQVRAEVRRLAQQVAGDLGEQGRPVARVVVKVRYAPFITKTHGQPLAGPAQGPAEIEEAALAALGRFTDHRPVRLLGVRAEFAPGDAP